MSIEAMEGETLTDITGLEPNSGEIRFRAESGRVFRLFHDQDCCESVKVSDVVGRMEDLIGVLLLVAREDSNYTTDDKPEYPDSFSWTFYNFSTVKGHVTVRWLGESNGCYSESVDFEEVK